MIKVLMMISMIEVVTMKTVLMIIKEMLLGTMRAMMTSEKMILQTLVTATKIRMRKVTQRRMMMMMMMRKAMRKATITMEMAVTTVRRTTAAIMGSAPDDLLAPTDSWSQLLFPVKSP